MDVKEAQDAFYEHLDEGVECPVCNRKAKVYRYSISSSMAQALITIVKSKDEWVHIPSLELAQSKPAAATSRLRHWNLIEEKPLRRGDGGRAGYWKATNLGISFANNQSAVQKYAHIFNNEVITKTGDYIQIEDALDNSFDYNELMEAV